VVAPWEKEGKTARQGLRGGERVLEKRGRGAVKRKGQA